MHILRSSAYAHENARYVQSAYNINTCVKVWNLALFFIELSFSNKYKIISKGEVS